MKRQLLLLVCAFILPGFVFSQLNPSFENWSGTAPGFNPDNWDTNNEFITTLEVNGPFVTQEMSATNGDYSAKLVTKTCPKCPSFNLPNPATGYMEQVEAFSGGVMDGVSFDYKYIPAAVTDTGLFQLNFTHWVSAGDSSSIDYRAVYTINPSAEWTTASTSFIINPILGSPDTLSIEFFTSLGGVGGIGTDTDGSELFIDNIRFTTVGVEESLRDILSIKAYPNPVVDYLILEVDNKDVHRVDFFDMTGKLVQSESLSNGTTRIELGHLSGGMHAYAVYAKDGRQMKSGKIFTKR